MGTRTRKNLSLARLPLRKPSVGFEGGGEATSSTCPDAITVEGVALEAKVGQTVGLVPAGGKLQLVVANRVAEISKIPSRARVEACVRNGESYIGRVTRAARGRFTAELSRAAG